jgi:hypothetical protein
LTPGSISRAAARSSVIAVGQKATSRKKVQLPSSRPDHEIEQPAAGRGDPTNGTHEIWEMVSQILSTRLPTKHLPVRLLGVGVSTFDQRGQSQGLLFEQGERQKHQKLDTVVDQITNRFGVDALRRASGLRPDG